MPRFCALLSGAKVEASTSKLLNSEVPLVHKLLLISIISVLLSFSFNFRSLIEVCVSDRSARTAVLASSVFAMSSESGSHQHKNGHQLLEGPEAKLNYGYKQGTR